MAAEMHDPLHTINGSLQFGHCREVGLDEGFVGSEIGRHHAIAPTDARISSLEQTAKMPADASRCAGDQDGLHGDLREIEASAVSDRMGWKRQIADSACGC